MAYCSESSCLDCITCDAYISYQELEQERDGDIKTSGCMMHARRYFAEAFFIQDVTSLTDEELRELSETQALFLIRQHNHLILPGSRRSRANPLCN